MTLFFMLKTILFWLHNARHVALPQSLLPSIMAVCLAMQTDSFSLWLSIAAIAGITMVHLGANLTDDYFDYKKNKQQIEQQNHPSKSPLRKGKCNYLINGTVTEKQLLSVISFLFLLGFIFAGIIFYYRGAIILYYILITGFLSITYSGFPLRLSYYGLGEISIGIIFGPLLVSGVFYASCGSFTSEMWTLSFIIGMLVLNILYIHSVMDYEADKSVNKKTLAVLIKNKNIMLAVAALPVFTPFIFILAGIYLQYLNYYYFVLLALLPLAIVLYYLLIQYIKHPDRIYKPHFWMGPMEQWDVITKAGIDQFMIRWFLARNLTVFFCILSIIVSFL
ncbi:MAG: 1,4-dihydroxy-2-naphthoate octaprenyltransferase [Bacteroidetes bacterium ADurb.Bin234]|nr:MAG: 1,4-dihydroxy-2-naphthoate octaprenyltransferase [Bacteroidetes bacterium ADurb.Bin234]